MFTDVDAGFFESQIDSIGVGRNNFDGYVKVAVVAMAGV
jgi:hypothetical protein